MIHLSNISINPDYISLIRWNVICTWEGTSIQPSIAVYLNIPTNGGLETEILYLPEDSPNARLLQIWRNDQKAIFEGN